MTDWMEAALNSEFIQNFLLTIINVLMVLVNLILLPIGLLMSTIIPELDQGLLQISDYFNLAGMYAGWILDMFLITPVALGAIVTLFTVRLTYMFIMFGVKLGIRWKKAIFT